MYQKQIALSQPNILTRITDALGQATELLYSGAGCASCGAGVDKLIGVIDANHVGAAEPRPMTAFAYFETGELKSETDPLGKTVLYAYDPSGRLKVIVSSAGTVTRSYFYDGEGFVLKDTSDGTTTTALNPFCSCLQEEASSEEVAIACVFRSFCRLAQSCLLG